MSDDLADDRELDAGLPSSDVTAALRLAEAYPSVPLGTLFTELRHADKAVATGVDHRAEIITGLVTARLGRSGATIDEGHVRRDGESDDRPGD